MSSRIQTARLRAERTKRLLAAGAAASFLAVMVLARDSHAGSSTAATSSRTLSSNTSTSSSGFTQESDDFSFGAPAGQAQVQTRVS